MRKSNCVVAVMFLILAAGLRAGELVPGLNDSSALKNYTAAYQGGEFEINPDITNGQMTLAARFNPDVSQSSGGPYIILEIGGTSNGSGLYLCDGHVIFACSTGTGPAVPPESMADTNFAVISNERTIAVDFGRVRFGSENVVYASLDLVAGRLICSVNNILNSYTITNTANTNLDGNESICFLTKGTALNGWMGGLHELNGSAVPLLYAANSAALTQTAGYNNQRGQIFNSMAAFTQVPHNPNPSNGQTNVDPSLVTQLQFATAEDPANPGSQNPNVTGHYVTVYDVDNGEPNVLVAPLLDTFVAAGSDPIAVSYTFSADDVVYWQVEEQISGAAKGEPNNIVGPIWHFEALPSVPVVTADPVDNAVFPAAQASFTCVMSCQSTPTTIAWYKSSAPGTPLNGADITVNTVQDGSTYTSTLTIDNVEPADEDSYYCYIQNATGNDTSGAANLGVKRQVAHWTLDESDLVGGQYLDTSGESHHAEPNIVPGAGSFVEGVDPTETGDGLDFTVQPLCAADSGDWAPSLRTGQVSISAWLKWAGSNAGWQGVVSNRSAVGETTANFYIEIRQDNGNLQIGGIAGAGDVQVAPLPVGEWTHMAVTARAGEIVIWINGEPMAANTAAEAVRRNIVPVRIGALNRDTTTGNLLSLYNGVIDDIQIFNYALSSTQVVDLYYAILETPTCVNPMGLDISFDVAGGGPAGDEPDCRITLPDFAAFVRTWLNCGLYPVCP